METIKEHEKNSEIEISDSREENDDSKKSFEEESKESEESEEKKLPSPPKKPKVAPQNAKNSKETKSMWKIANKQLGKSAKQNEKRRETPKKKKIKRTYKENLETKEEQSPPVFCDHRYKQMKKYIRANINQKIRRAAEDREMTYKAMYLQAIELMDWLKTQQV